MHLSDLYNPVSIANKAESPNLIEFTQQPIRDPHVSGRCVPNVGTLYKVL